MAAHEVMTVKADPIYLTFIPFCFRKPTGAWFYNHSVATVVMDRLRILNLAGSRRRFQRLASLQQVTELIKATESMV